VRPFISGGGGAYYVTVNGNASFPYVGTMSWGWMGLAEAGTGAEVRLGSHVGIAVEVHVLASVPHPVVTFLTDNVAGGVSPGLLGSVTLLGWL
jgi:hypothetical protein